MLDIEEYLVSKGIAVQRVNADEIKMHCFFHGEEEDRPGRLYVHVGQDDKYGLWNCFVCNEAGGINKMRAYFGDAPITSGDDSVFSSIYNLATKYYEQRLFDDAPDYKGFLYLTDKRGLTEETLLDARVGYSDGKLHEFLIREGVSPSEARESGLVKIDGSDFFAKGSIIFPYFDYGRVTQLRCKIPGGKTYGLPGVSPDAYNKDRIKGQETVLIAEGEIDTLTLHQLGFNAVGVPGAQMLTKKMPDLVSEAKRVFILFDNDAAGVNGAEKMASAIGPKSRVVEIPGKGNDVNDFFLQGAVAKGDFDFLLSKSKGGLLVSPFQAFERWTEVEGNPDAVGLKLGIKTFDDALVHGVTPGQIVTVLGRTNSGKSMASFNMTMRISMAQPEATFMIFSLEQTRNEWFERMYKIHNFYFPGSSPMDVVEYWTPRLALVDKNRVSRDQFIDCLDQVAYDFGEPPSFTLIDYLGYWARAFPGEAKERTSEAMMTIKEVGKEYATRFIVPHQANRTGTLGGPISLEMAKDSAVVEETSDLILSIWRPEQREQGNEDYQSEYPRGTTFMEILKSRGGPIGARAQFQMTPLTLALVPTDDPLYNRALQEVSYSNSNDNFLQAVNRHKTGSVEL